MSNVSSEIYQETDLQSVENTDGKVISKFKFSYPQSDRCLISLDEDGDTIVERKKLEIITVEHSTSTRIGLVGLQVWRGSLLLCDFIFFNFDHFSAKIILELAAGVGLTSIVASMCAKRVICTDINDGGILQLIASNIERNKHLVKSDIEVMEFNFKADTFTEKQNEAIRASSIILVADVIYDDEITDSFISVIDYIFELGLKKEIYIALEKRFVFTLAEMDAVAPCFEHFIRMSRGKKWIYSYIDIDFPQYFHYKRCENLILLKLNNK